MISRIAHSSYFAVKHKVDWFDRWPVWQKVRRGFQAPFYRLADTGWFGLTPLKMHILICGFPASGTTLLQLMVENGFPQARRFGKERSGWKAATYSLRNHELLISKQPRDLLRLEPLQEFYQSRKAKLRVIVMLRDPRDLLTTKRRDGDQTEYGGSAQDWREYQHCFVQHRNRPDTIVVRYEDLIENVAAEQQRVEEFVGRKMAVPFADFLSVDRKDFDTSTLRGLRPLDRSRISRWRDPSHRQRLVQMLNDLPELPAVVRELGYESDDEWTREYLLLTSTPKTPLSLLYPNEEKRG